MRFMIIAATILFPTLLSAQSADEAMRLDMNGTAQQQQSQPQAQANTAPLANSSTSPITGGDSFTAAQSSTGQGNNDDKDHMIACSIIYQRISDMYQERGERDKADSFIRTAYAYSQTADILFTRELGMERGYDAITERMSLVSDSLNRESQAMPNGDLGVIENWLGWCDERGEFVQDTIDAANAQN